MLGDPPLVWCGGANFSRFTDVHHFDDSSGSQIVRSVADISQYWATEI
jgi:hypothetical protein